MEIKEKSVWRKQRRFILYKENRFETHHIPFLGRGILGSGWHKQTCSLVSEGALIVALFRARSSILGWFVDSIWIEAALFRVRRTGGEGGRKLWAISWSDDLNEPLLEDFGEILVGDLGKLLEALSDMIIFETSAMVKCVRVWDRQG